MPEYIIRIPHKGKDYYLNWSTIVDAPVSPGFTRDEFDIYMGNTEKYHKRMARVDKNGTSALNQQSVASLLSFNRAGPNEERLSIEGIIYGYIETKGEWGEEELRKLQEHIITHDDN